MCGFRWSNRRPGDSRCRLLVWTTTPWTLPSNQFAAVQPDLEYSWSRTASEQRLIVASALVETLAAKVGRKLTCRSTLPGEKLVGLRYRAAVRLLLRTLGDAAGHGCAAARKQHVAWRVVAAEFVTIDSGTGVVHQAPAFGEVDFDVLHGRASTRFARAKGPT